MKLITSTIGEISEKIQTGKTPPTKTPEYFNGNFNWYTPGDFLQTLFLDLSARTISEKAITEKKAIIFEKNTVLISCIGDIGKIGVLQHKASCNQQITGITLKTHIDPLFFAFWCRANKSVLENRARNAVVPILNNAVLSSISFTYPEAIDDQKRIAHLLSKVEGMTTRRKQHQKQLDELLKSVFLEMFGDPMHNEKGWECHLFSNLFSTSPRIGTTKPVSPDGTVPVVRVGELGNFQVNFNNCKNAILDNESLDKCRVEVGDILLARAIASQSHLGKASLIISLHQDTAFDSHVMRIRFKEQIVNSIYAYYWLKSDGGRNRFLNAGGQTSVQFNINSKQISSIKMTLPPITLQNKFATIVSKVESLKSRYQSSLSNLENLYGALSQKAFKGELDLERVSLVDITTEGTGRTDTDSGMVL